MTERLWPNPPWPALQLDAIGAPVGSIGPEELVMIGRWSLNSPCVTLGAQASLLSEITEAYAKLHKFLLSRLRFFASFGELALQVLH